MLLRFAAENATEVPQNVVSAIAASNAAVSTLLEAAQTPGRSLPFDAIYGDDGEFRVLLAKLMRCHVLR